MVGQKVLINYDLGTTILKVQKVGNTGIRGMVLSFNYKDGKEEDRNVGGPVFIPWMLMNDFTLLKN